MGWDKSGIGMIVRGIGKKLLMGWWALKMGLVLRVRGWCRRGMWSSIWRGKVGIESEMREHTSFLWL